MYYLYMYIMYSRMRKRARAWCRQTVRHAALRSGGGLGTRALQTRVSALRARDTDGAECVNERDAEGAKGANARDAEGAKGARHGRRGRREGRRRGRRPR
jgi:hypothetical protein